MDSYGTLRQYNERHILRFKRQSRLSQDDFFDVTTKPRTFKQWYPCATGEIELVEGGKIQFEDEDGSRYEAEILHYQPPTSFTFKEIDDFIEIYIEEDGDGSILTFVHAFDDATYAASMAAGWHNCLDILLARADGESPKLKNDTKELHEYYTKAFQ